MRQVNRMKEAHYRAKIMGSQERSGGKDTLGRPYKRATSVNKLLCINLKIFQKNKLDHNRTCN